MDEYDCQWCKEKIVKGSDIVLIVSAKLDGGAVVFANQPVAKDDIVAVYHSTCWEEFIASLK